MRETGLPSTASASAQAAPELRITPGVASGALDSRHVYAALDLGTNNCRLLIARPEHRPRRRNNDFLRIIDAFSRIVRLGEGLGKAGRISEEAIERTIAALQICREKMDARGVTRARLVATQACRSAANGDEFVERVRERTGLQLEIIDRETEARFAARGCGSLADPAAESVLLFDIGGGSTELVWLTRERRSENGAYAFRAWTSLELGVVTLAEHFGGRCVSAETFAAMAQQVRETLAPFARRMASERRCPRFHLLGTSGTVTTLAGVHLGLERYDRWRVDGLWMSDDDATRAILRLRDMDFDERVANGCIGPQRADLVLAGCAIFEAIRTLFPAQRTRIADRGLREGMLLELMEADGALTRRA
ncbi:Ppx/GppA family phosphatase [Methylocystis sp. FS]|uniref:Ppx/GppA phosphatase family protein n=1 Tax=Methylocystis silviterrae TaxID=2743612 RepID=UPI0015840704|nr:Ppx/GppA family phosphatase [Methylocystis silviterrae]